MAGFEDLIRGALIKQGTTTPESRERVYNSARQALDRMLADETKFSPEVANAQRTKLETAISEIDAGYAKAEVSKAAEPATPVRLEIPEDTPPAPSDASDRDLSTAAPKVEHGVAPTPDIAAQRPAKPAPPVESIPKPARQEPQFDARAPTGNVGVDVPPPVPPGKKKEAPAKEEPAPATVADYTGDALKERKPYAKLLLWTIIIVGIAAAIWWAITFGPAMIEEKLGGRVANPQPTLESGAFIPNQEDGNGWVTVFLPDANAADVVTTGAGAAELQVNGEQSVMRMASPSRETKDNLLIKIPRGIMSELRGQAGTFELIVQATEAETQEFVMYCQFGAMGTCGRKRFTATANLEPIIFDVLINDAELGENEDAYLAINTDFENKGRSLDIFAIRLRIGS